MNYFPGGGTADADQLAELAKKWNPDPLLQAAAEQNAKMTQSPYFGMSGAPYVAQPAASRFPFAQMVEGVSGIPFVEGDTPASPKKVPGQNPLSPQAMALLNSMMPAPAKPQYIGGAAPRQGPTNIQMTPVMAAGMSGHSAPPGLNVDIPSLAALINGTAYKR